MQTYTQLNLGQPETQASDALTVRLFGEDHDVLREQAEKMKQTLAGIMKQAG